MVAIAKRMKPWAEKIQPGKQFQIDEALALVKEVKGVLSAGRR